MINSIKNGDQPLPRVTQMSIAGTSSTEQPPLKDKSMWHMLGSEYGKQDMKAAVLYEYETFKATEGELLLDTYIQYLQVINDLKSVVIIKITNLMDINIDALYNILKQKQGDVNEVMGSKKKKFMVTFDPLALVAEKTKSANKKQEFVKTNDKKEDKKVDEKKRDMSIFKCCNCKKEGHFAKDCKKAKVKDYEYYKTKMLLAKKDKDEQVLFAEDQAWMESNSDSDQEINANMVFMDQIEKVFFDSKATSSSADEKISEESYYLSESEKNFHDAIESTTKNFIENHIDSQKDYDKSDVDHNDSEEKEHLVDKLIRKFNHKIAKCQKRIEKANQQSTDFENQNKDLQDKYVVLKNQATTFEMNNNELNEQLKVLIEKNDDLLAQTKTVDMIMPLKDNLYNGRKGIGFENLSYFEKAKDLRPTLYDEKDIGLGYTSMFLTHSNEALETEKFKRTRENKIEFAYDYGNLNASYIIIDLEDEVVNLLEKEKANLQTIESLKSKECDKEENPKVIAPGMFKLSVSQCVSSISMSKLSCESNNVKIKLKRKRHTFSSVRRHKNSGVIWKKKGSSNNSKVDLSAVSCLKLNKNVKRYSRKDLLACNNSHLGETSSAYVCNNAMNVSCNSSMCDLLDDLDDNNFFIFDDESVRISLVSKMPFRKKPCDSMIVRSKSNSNKSLPRTHMTGNRALLTNFMEKFLGTVRFGNNDFDVTAGYGDVVIGYMTIMKVFYVEGLEHNLFSVRQFCDKGLEVAFRKSTCFVRNEDGVDLLTGDRSSNLYTIALNEVASNYSTCLIVKASSLQSWLWHQCLSHLNFATINNLMKNNLVQGLPKMKFEKDHLCSACEQWKIHRKHHKSKTEFASNKPLYLLHMDLCGPMRISSINVKRFVLVVVDDYSRYTWVFFLHSKDEASEIMKSSTTNVETSINEDVFLEVSKSFQGESSSSSLNDDVQQSITSHNVFNERLEDAYFDATTSFHDPSNVHTFYQSYPHEKKWTKDHPLYKIIAEALRDVDWVSAMPKEIVQFARLKVWRLVPRPEEEVYVGQPPGFFSKQYPDHAYALDKDLYGLKQAPQATGIDLPRSLPSHLGKLGL
nr:retrovirus-related Pol polyprotein from transposon TNT 1-94 [Tanacetum cinerariifolium]